MADITKSGILNAVKKINHPGLNTDFLILNSVKSLEADGKKLNLTLVLPMAQDAVNNELLNKIEDAVKSEFPQIKKVNLNIESRPHAQAQQRHSQPAQQTNQASVLPNVRNTIAVASGKGGVGKSTVAVNIAAALAKDGARVGLIDADIYGPSIPLMLGIKDKPKVYQDANTRKMIPLEKYDIKMISIGLLVDEDAPVIWRGPMASGAVKQFMSDVDWDELDYLIFDMPPGTGDIQLTLVQTIPLTGAVIVTTPQEVSLIDARKALKMFTRVNVPILGVVENMSYFIAPDTGKKYDIFGTGGGSKLAEELDAPFLGGIPIDPRIRLGGDAGIPLVHDPSFVQHSDLIVDISRKLAKEAALRNSGNGSKVDIIFGDE